MAAAQNLNEIAMLIQLLEHQRALYRRLRQLADRQQTLVLADDHQPLLELLAERQRLVDALVSLSARMAPIRERYVEISAGMDASTQQNVAELVREANDSLSAILQNDARDTATLNARREQTSQQLTALNNAGRVGAAYRATARQAVLADAEA